jgi:alpha-soluble NSF attachment protein
MLQDAYKSYKDISPPDAIRCLDASIKLYTAKGNFRRAADLMCDLADTYEKSEDLAKALQCLETAITWYNDENIQATANKARQKAGQLAAMLGDYYKAVTIFVQGAEASMSTGPTGRFIVKTYLFKAGSESEANSNIRCRS